MTTWSLAWRSALARRRLLVWNVAVPLLLLAPVAVSEAAAPHRTAVFGVFFVFFATFGSAIPTVRDAGSGWLDAVFRTGTSRSRWYLETAAAEAVLDLLQLAPTTALLVWTTGGPETGSLVALAGALAVAILFANLIGPVLAAAVRSLAEAALASAAVSLLLLHFAGFFRTPTPGWSERIASILPYRPLREALAGLQAAGPPSWDSWAPALLAAILAVAALAVSAPGWTRRFEWPDAG